jgi:hypothetical protein
MGLRLWRQDWTLDRSWWCFPHHGTQRRFGVVGHQRKGKGFLYNKPQEPTQASSEHRQEHLRAFKTRFISSTLTNSHQYPGDPEICE